MKPENINKAMKLWGKLNAALNIRSKLLSGEHLELVIGTGGKAQSVEFTQEFDRLVRTRMIREMEDQARTHAESLREIDATVELPFDT